jgi:hypothetical protein
MVGVCGNGERTLPQQRMRIAGLWHEFTLPKQAECRCAAAEGMNIAPVCYLELP